MATGQIEDIYSAVNITVFSKTYEENKAVLNSMQPIILYGKVSEREDRDIEVICEKAESMPQSAENAVRKKAVNSGLYIKIPSTDSPVFGDIKRILANFKGQNPVFIVCADTNKKLSAPESLFVSYSEDLISKIETVAGKGNVRFVK